MSKQSAAHEWQANISSLLLCFSISQPYFTLMSLNHFIALYSLSLVLQLHDVRLITHLLLGLATRFQLPKFHVGRPRERGELCRLLSWRRQALSHQWCWWQTCQNLGLPKQDLCPDARRPCPGLLVISRNPYWGGRLRTVDLLVLSSLD